MKIVTESEGHWNCPVCLEGYPYVPSYSVGMVVLTPEEWQTMKNDIEAWEVAWRERDE